jgi:uncharacterized protein DUF5686/carboxypeptidase-like protein
MKHILFLILFFVFANAQLDAQDYILKGKVVDAVTDVPLAFVNIVIDDGWQGTATDIDGKFKLQHNKEIHHLKLSYVGYQSKTLSVEGQNEVLIKLDQIKFELPEVTILPGENPAHRIIQNVIDNKDRNDPEKLPSFSYTAYDKMYFTIDRDSLRKFDTIMPDTTMQKVKKFINEKHFFLMETVTERKFMAPERNHEKVTASRISGFKDPILVFMISQMQSTSFYDDIIQILGKNYINPISKGSLNKYFFLIEDTAYSAKKDTVFIISYRPRRKTNFDGMKGVLSINSNTWAIQNVIARPAKSEGMDVKIQQLYKQIDGKHWFPVQLNTDLIMQRVEVQAGGAHLNMIGVGKSYLKDIELKPDLVARQFSNIEVEIEPDAYVQKETFWKKYRSDSLSQQEKRTYTFIDSVGKEHHFDRIARMVEAGMSGQIPFGHVNLDLDKFFRYNSYEGFYLGMGAHTNDRLSKFFTLGGYAGYGFKDKTSKYGAKLDLNIWRRHNLKMGFSYFEDVTESAGVHFFDDAQNMFSPENFRNMLVKRMNMTQNFSTYLRFTTLKYLSVNLSLARQFKDAYRDYQFVENVGPAHLLQNQFVFAEAGIALRYAYKETFMQTAKSKVSLGTDYPIVWLQYTKGLKDIFDGQYEYDRFDLKIEESFFTKYLGKTTLRLMAGYIEGEVPYCNLFNGNGSYRSFTINAPFSFATMRMNEFLSNKYLSFYFYHDFGNLLFGGKKFRPELAIASNFVIGSLDNPEQHLNTNFNTLDKGYYESGLLLNKLLDFQIYSLGLGAFYRYGPYSFDEAGDNVALRLSLKFPF